METEEVEDGKGINGEEKREIIAIQSGMAKNKLSPEDVSAVVSVLSILER